MLELIHSIVNSEERIDLHQLLHQLRWQNKSYLLRNNILDAFNDYCKTLQKPESFCNTSQVSKLIYHTQEIILENETCCLVVRPQIGHQQIFHIAEDLQVEPMSVQGLLDLRDRLVNHFHPNEGGILELDFRPFHDYSPMIRDWRNIGKGVQFLNHYLSSKLQESQQLQEKLFNFLSLHNDNGTQLLINQHIQNHQQLSLARIYGFWNYASKENLEDLLRYLETIFHLVFKPRAQQILAQHIQR